MEWPRTIALSSIASKIASAYRSSVISAMGWGLFPCPGKSIARAVYPKSCRQAQDRERPRRHGRTRAPTKYQACPTSVMNSVKIRAYSAGFSTQGKCPAGGSIRNGNPGSTQPFRAPNQGVLIHPLILQSPRSAGVIQMWACKNPFQKSPDSIHITFVRLTF